MAASTVELRQAIQGRLQRVQEQIESSARSAGRPTASIRLVVVTKAQPVHVARAAVEAGARILGENYPEQAVAKIEELQDVAGIEWHMIGHIQSRKAELVARHFHLVHSLDSLRLAQKLDRLGGELRRSLPVLLEFNVGGEPSKHGWNAGDPSKWSLLVDEIGTVAQFPNLCIRGFMTMPPLANVPADSRPHFRRLRELADFLRQQIGGTDWTELSMGTSSDYTVAVEEGATLIRVGEAILGPRRMRDAV